MKKMALIFLGWLSAFLMLAQTSVLAGQTMAPAHDSEITSYTIIGAEAIMGSNFDVNDANNNMTLKDGVYQLVKSSVLLKEGDYKFKVVGNHSYDAYQFPGNAMDQVLSIGADALYDITFTFNPALPDEDPNKLVAETEYLIPAAAKYYVAGNGGASPTWLHGKNWELAAPENLLEAGKITYPGVDPGTYEFQVTNGTWSQAWGHSKLDKMNSSPGHIQGENDNIKFELAQKADITIRFNGSMVVLLIDYSPYITVYTVVGPEKAFGTEYDVNDPSNEMKAVDSVYVLTKKVTLTKGTYEYKVVGDHDYAKYEFPGPGMNKLFTVEEEGDYTLTITFNPKEEDSSDFKLVAKLQNGFVGIQEMNVTPSVYVQNKTIFVENNVDFKVYDLTGKDVSSLNGSLYGIYLVRIADKTLKVVVR